jgi:large conductance mechanosensitive channel
MSGFKKFLLRGNLVDLAVAVVVGVAFNNVVHALITDLITPLLGAVWKKPDFSALVLTVHGGHFHYGDFINVALTFLIVAAVVYYLVVAPANRITVIAARNAEATERPCPECLSDIPVAARRCKFCTAIVEPYPNGHSSRPSPAGVHRQLPTWRPHS